MNKVTNIHFVGIKGVGMTPLAIIAKEAGINVTGSDISDVFITDTALKEQNIKVFVGFSADHVIGAELVIVTGAHAGFDNIEAITATQKNIPVISQAQAVGEYMKGEFLGRSFTGVSIAGSHGKTTTSGMIASLLKSAGQDPSYLIGTSYIPSLGYSGHLGKGNYFIAEADEYVSELKHDSTPKFLWQHPKFLVITNIEHDHPDVYPNLLSVKKAFQQLISQQTRDNTIIFNGDDVQLQSIAHNIEANAVTFGYQAGNAYFISNVEIAGMRTTFQLRNIDADLGLFSISVPGEHNVLNAVAAIVFGLQIELPVEDIRKYIVEFTGSKRRLEYVGESVQGAVLYDDYAHHPTEIKASLKTLRKIFPKHYIICVFQPHTFSRTQALFSDFATSFNQANFVVITDTYASLREQQVTEENNSAIQLCQAITLSGTYSHYESKLPDVIEYINNQKFPYPTLIVTMGAGDIYKILPEL